jgi:sulfoxide reductase heme-binding subunit YedZ
MKQNRARVSGIRVLWHDRGGRFSWLKALVLLECCWPALWLAYGLAAGELGPRPLNEAIHESGQFAVRVLVASLAVSPARMIFDWPRIMLVRRMLGLTAAAYVLIHLSLYIADQNFRVLHVGSEILHRFYLTIGFTALVGLAALAVTSTDAMMRRLGRRWKSLHRLVYPIAVLALVHHCLQAKADVSDAVLLAGLFVWLMLWRALPRQWQRNVLAVGLLAPLAGVATAAIEFTWYALATGINPWRVLAANLEFDWDFGLRPSAWVTITGAGIVVAMLLRRLVRYVSSKATATSPESATLRPASVTPPPGG